MKKVRHDFRLTQDALEWLTNKAIQDKISRSKLIANAINSHTKSENWNDEFPWFIDVEKEKNTTVHVRINQNIDRWIKLKVIETGYTCSEIIRHALVGEYRPLGMPCD